MSNFRNLLFRLYGRGYLNTDIKTQVLWVILYDNNPEAACANVV